VTFFRKTSFSGRTGHAWGACALHLNCLHAPRAPFHAPGACSWLPHSPATYIHALVACVWSGYRNVYFFAFLGVYFYVSCLETWEQNSSLCKVFEASWIIILHLSKDHINFLMSLLFRFAWFICELRQKHPKIAMFREEKNYRLKYRYYKCPEIIGNCSNTPLLCW
jgi:hypothetical protein